MVPGHELVGIVTETGSDVTDLKVGDRVGVGCYVESCQSCSYCTKDASHHCPSRVFTYNSKNPRTGEVEMGGYSDHTVVRADHVNRIPANLPLSAAAPLLCAGITVYSPLRRYNLDKPGVKVGVLGLGGLGHMAVKIAAAMGCEVTVLTRSASKAADAARLGAKHVLVSTDADAMAKVCFCLHGCGRHGRGALRVALPWGHGARPHFRS